VFAPGVEQRGRYALRALVYLALAGKRATADRIRVQKAIPEYLEGKGNGPFCGVKLLREARFARVMLLAWRARCGRHWLETRGGERVAEMRSGMTPRGFFPEQTGN
jgi:hypothetical protein